MLEILIFCFLGSLLGFLSGLIPSLHQNLIIPLLITLFIDKHLAFSFLISLAIAQNFGNFISSLLFSSPPEEISLSLLPSQRLAKKNRLFEAYKISLLSVFSIPISVLIAFLFSNFLAKFYQYLEIFIAPLLLYFLSLIFYQEEKKLLSLIIFFISGIFGIFAFNFLEFNKAILAMFSGFFAMPNIIINILFPSEILKKQEEVEIEMDKFDIFKGISLGIFGGIISGLLPSLGPSQILLTFQSFLNDKVFILASSSMFFSNEIFSLTNSYTIENPRSGLAVYLTQKFGKFEYEDFIISLVSILLASSFGIIFSIFVFSKIFNLVKNLNYRFLNTLIFSIIVLIVLIFSGLEGLLILFISTSLALLTILLEVKRSYLIGSLTFSTLLIYSKTYPYLLMFLNL
ncbi:MAG: tripartite tricarboxylate transporter permease [Candidatus Aenigmatarchaeota archaeon]